MRIRCCLVPSGLQAQVELPEELVSGGTVRELAAFLAQGDAAALERAGKLPRLTVAGFSLLPSEPIAGVLRETDVVAVHCSTENAALEAPEQQLALQDELMRGQESGQGAGRAVEALEGPSRRKRRKAAPVDQLALHDKLPAEAASEPEHAQAGAELQSLTRLTHHQAARIGELVAELEARGSRLGELEGQVVELQRRLANADAAAAAAVERAEKAEQRPVAAPRPAKEARGASAAGSAMPQGWGAAASSGAAAGSSAASAGAAVGSGPPQEWVMPMEAGPLRAGDVVEYRVALVDGWEGRMRKSGRREATVERLVPEAASGPSVVLRQVGGAMDCMEVSRLLGLRVKRPRGGC